MRGLAAALGACLLWGNSALFFKPTEDLAMPLVLAIGSIWAAIIFTVFFQLRRSWPAIRQEWRSRRKTLACISTALINIVSWGIFIWAVQNDQAVAASLGLFLGPLLMCLVGLVFLGERINHWQALAITLAAIGVGYSLWQSQSMLFVALLVAGTFATQNPIRKVFGLAPIIGVYTETLISLPIAVAYLVISGAVTRPDFLELLFLPGLILAGVILVVPLMLYVEGARKLPLTTLGILTYVSPTIQLLVATLILDEPFSTTTAVTFAFIWAGLAVYTSDGWRRQFRPVGTEPLS